MEDREAEVVHDFVAVLIAVPIDLHAHREALHTQVEISTHCTLDADVVRDVSMAVVAVVQGPAVHHKRIRALPDLLAYPNTYVGQSTGSYSWLSPAES